MAWSILTGALLGLAIGMALDWRYRRMLKAKLEFMSPKYVDGRVCYVWGEGSWWRVRAWRLPMVGDEGDAVGDWPSTKGGSNP